MLVYQLRPATAEDVGFLTDVVLEATRAQGRIPDGFDERHWRTGFGTWTVEQIRGNVPDSMTSVIEVGSERVGRLRIVCTGDHVELCGIQLLPAIQGNGIGTAIIGQLKAQAAAAGVPLDLAVEKDNPDARRLYQRLGFVQIGETEEEYNLRWNSKPGDGKTDVR